MAAFDFFITLDGNCLNGFEGLCGVARLRCDPDADRWEKEIHFFEGLAGGHATQVNPTVARRGSLVPEQLVPERGDDQGDAGGDEGPDGLEAGDGLRIALDLLLEREQAVDDEGWMGG